jgi:hypothetical protein
MNLTDNAEKDVKTLTGIYCPNCESDVFLTYEIQKREDEFIQTDKDDSVNDPFEDIAELMDWDLEFVEEMGRIAFGDEEDTDS